MLTIPHFRGIVVPEVEMATVSREIAEQQIAHCKKRKRPRMYCIARYFNLEFGVVGYSLCYTAKDYAALLNSSAVGKANAGED